MRWLTWTALSLSVAGCKPDASVPDQTPAASAATLTVAVKAVETKDVPHLVSATGTVMPWQELTVDAEVSSLAVVEVRVKENDTVHAGDVLVRLNDRSLRAQVAQQKAAVAEAQANLQSAKQSAARGDALVLQKAMSQETVETRRTTILTDQAKLDQAMASLDQLQAQLDQTVIRAPASGIVSTDPIKLGTVTQAGTELLRIIRDGKLEAQLKVTERDLARIRPGQAARITLPDGTAADGSVRGLAAKLDSSTRLGVVYVSLPSRSDIHGGMFVAARITLDHYQALVVAGEALVWPDGKPSVFVVGADNKASLRALAVADQSGAEVVVSDGVSAGDRLVTAGAGFLHDGDPVQVRPAIATNISSVIQ